MLPVLIEQSRSATAHLARSAAPDAPVVPFTAASPSSPAPRVLRRRLAAILRRSAERLAPVAE